FSRDWSSDVCSSDLMLVGDFAGEDRVDFGHVPAGELGHLRLLDELVQGLAAAADAAPLHVDFRLRLKLAPHAVQFGHIAHFRAALVEDRKSTRLNSSHVKTSYAV